MTLYPVVLLLFGLGMSAKVAFGVMHGLVPMTLFTLGAVRNLPPVLVRTAKVLRLSPGRTMRWVLVPACLPDIVNGLRISFSLSLLGVLIGEMFSSQRGLGFLLVNGMAQNNVPLSTAVVTVIVAVAILANTLMLRLGETLRAAGPDRMRPDRPRQENCMTRPTTTLKTIFQRREATIFAGAANGLFARIIEDLGYEAVYVTGAGVANMYLGAPDIGLTTLTEIANHVAAISDAVAFPCWSMPTPASAIRSTWCAP